MRRLILAIAEKIEHSSVSQTFDHVYDEMESLTKQQEEIGLQDGLKTKQYGIFRASDFTPEQHHAVPQNCLA